MTAMQSTHYLPLGRVFRVLRFSSKTVPLAGQWLTSATLKGTSFTPHHINVMFVIFIGTVSLFPAERTEIEEIDAGAARFRAGQEMQGVRVFLAPRYRGRQQLRVFAVAFARRRFRHFGERHGLRVFRSCGIRIVKNFVDWHAFVFDSVPVVLLRVPDTCARERRGLWNWQQSASLRCSFST